jgi:hypothetical protein
MIGILVRAKICQEYFCVIASSGSLVALFYFAILVLDNSKPPVSALASDMHSLDQIVPSFKVSFSFLPLQQPPREMSVSLATNFLTFFLKRYFISTKCIAVILRLNLLAIAI